MRPIPAPSSPEPRLQRMLRMATDAVILSLVVFTPLAFGSVERWAIGIIQWGAAVVFLLWVLRRAHGGGGAGAHGSRAWPQLHRLGFFAPVAAFIGLVLVQLVPLPPSILRLLSPTTHALYTRTLPGYGAAGQVDMNDMEKWLLGSAPSAPASDGDSPASWEQARDPALRFSQMRPISLVSSSTRHALGVFLAYLVLFLVVLERCASPSFRRALLWTVAFTGVLVAMLGLAQGAGWGDRVYGKIRPAYGGSPMGPFVNRNHFAGYMEMALGVLVGLWIAIVRRERTDPSKRPGPTSGAWHETRFVPQVFMVSVLVLTAALALWRSGSRGGLIAMAGAMAVLSLPMLWHLGGTLRRRGMVLALVVLIVVGAGFKVYELTQAESLEPELTSEPSFGKRLRVWDASLGMLLRFPVFGTGFGTYAYAIPLYQRSGYERMWIYAHNDYVQLACETGVTGVVFFAAGFGWFMRRFLLPLLRNPVQWGGASLGCALGMAAILIHSLVDFNLQIPSNGLLFCLLAASWASSGRNHALPADGRDAAEPSTSPRRFWWRGAAAAAICLGASAAVAVSVAARHEQSSGTALFWQGDLAGARARLERAAWRGRWMPDVHADLGFFYLRVLEDEWERGRTTLRSTREEAEGVARRALLRAIHMNPVNGTAWWGLAEMYRLSATQRMATESLDISTLIEGPVEMSRQDGLHRATLRRLLSLEPRNPYYHALLGDFFWQHLDRSAALREYEEAVRLHPRIQEHTFLTAPEVHPEILQAAIRGAQRTLADGSADMPPHRVHSSLSELHDKAGDTRKAIEHLEKAFSLNPEYTYYERRLGHMLFKAGDLDRSREILMRSAERGVQSKSLYMVLARIARQKNEPEAAISAYRKAQSLDPDDGRLAMELAQFFEETGDTRSADRFYELSTELVPSDVRILASAAEYYARRGMTVRAIPVLERILALRPQDEVYRRRLEQLRERAGLMQ